MKQEIISALNAKFGGVSEAIIGRVADKLINSGKVKNSEDIADAVAGVSFQQVLEQYGDHRANEAQKTAVRNYEKTHQLKDGKPVEDHNNGQQPGEGTPNADDTPAWGKALMERLDRIESVNAANSRKQQLSGVIAKLPEAMRKAYERLPLEKYTPEEFSSTMAEITSEVESIANSNAARGGVFGKPSAASGQNKAELTEAQKAAIAHREGPGSADAQPF